MAADVWKVKKTCSSIVIQDHILRIVKSGMSSEKVLSQ